MLCLSIANVARAVVYSLCIGWATEIRGLVIVDASVLDYVTPSALAREGLRFEYTSVYNELDHVISIVYIIYTKFGPKCLPLMRVHQ